MFCLLVGLSSGAWGGGVGLFGFSGGWTLTMGFEVHRDSLQQKCFQLKHTRGSNERCLMTRQNNKYAHFQPILPLTQRRTDGQTNRKHKSAKVRISAAPFTEDNNNDN